jgi:SNF2 family DNA or RNA helicase
LYVARLLENALFRRLTFFGHFSDKQNMKKQIELSNQPLSMRPTPGGIPISLIVKGLSTGIKDPDPDGWRLCLEQAKLKLLREFDELLCLHGITGVEHLPHQIETVRKVLRYFRGRVLLADEVGLGKTIEACLLLREFLLRGMAVRVLILVPAALVSQWQEELSSKFALDFHVLDSRDDEWKDKNLVLSSINAAKGKRCIDAITARDWDLVIVDEAHHCKNRTSKNWKLVNSLRRRHLFLLSATPVQNDLLEIYNLLTLLEPGHLKNESDFKKNFIKRGNPRDPKNRNRLRQLLGEVMIRNTRSLVSVSLPRRYAHTMIVVPDKEEAEFYTNIDRYLRLRRPSVKAGHACEDAQTDESSVNYDLPVDAPDNPIHAADRDTRLDPAASGNADGPAPLSRMRINHLLMAAGSHPQGIAPMLEQLSVEDSRAAVLAKSARSLGRTAKEKKLLELLKANRETKTLVFASFSETLLRLEKLLAEEKIPAAVFSGRQSAAEKDAAVKRFEESALVLLCSESGGEGRNLQFANTLINFDLPWNPMRIEQRIGRIHRIGQTREVFIFNLCVEGSMEARVVKILDDKIRMFELVVGEIGGILGNLEGGEEFESLILNLWLSSEANDDLDAAFDALSEKILVAQSEYVQSKQLDEALFGSEFE